MTGRSASAVRHRVFIVGRDPSFTRSLGQAFSRNSFEVETANTSHAARVRVAEAPPDLVALDLDFPNGAELVRQWKLRAPALAVMMVSAGAATLLDERGQLLLDQSIVKSDALAELGRFKDEVAAMIVHDLKNPLSVIVSNYDYILDGFEGSADRLEALQDSQHAGRRMIRLLDNLIDVARLESKTLPVRLSEILLTQLLQTLTEQRRVFARSRDLTLVFAAAPEITAAVDADLLTRVIENLLDDALRRAMKGSSIELALIDLGDHVELRIGNSAAAIAIGAHDSLFDKYQHATPGNGRGSLELGLYFCRLAIEAQGGRIWVEESARLPIVFALRLPKTSVARS